MLFYAKDVYELLMWHIENNKKLNIELIKAVMEEVDFPNDWTEEQKQTWRTANIFIRMETKRYLELIRTISQLSTKATCEAVDIVVKIFGSEGLEQFLIMKKLN
jgi:DNA-directed RNA polymerase subunit F